MCVHTTHTHTHTNFLGREATFVNELLIRERMNNGLIEEIKKRKQTIGVSYTRKLDIQAPGHRGRVAEEQTK